MMRGNNGFAPVKVNNRKHQTGKLQVETMSPRQVVPQVPPYWEQLYHVERQLFERALARGFEEVSTAESGELQALLGARYDSVPAPSASDEKGLGLP
jgi:hypothetical protein